MTEEFKDCPFCGSSPLISGDSDNNPRCCNPYCEGSTFLGSAKEWNTRPLETAAYIRGLQRAVEIVTKSGAMYLLPKTQRAVILELEQAIQEEQG